MSGGSLFSNPLVLGFDHFERALDRISKASGDGYPPYNIERVGDERLRITFAVAGFTKDDLEVSVEDNQLIVRGKHPEEPGRAYLHRGIAFRQFQRTFVLADGIEVVEATLDNGLLHIDLVRPVAEPQVRTIEIRGAAAGADDEPAGPVRIGSRARGPRA